MSKNVQELVDSANQAARAGNWQAAERAWEEVVSVQPTHTQALCSLGIHALQRGDTETALQRLTAARTAAPSDFLTLMTLAAVHRQREDALAEREALDAALTVDPYFVPALLAKADWMERFSTPAAAAALYNNILKISPPEKDWPADFRSKLTHARDVVTRHTAALQKHLQRNLDDAIDKLPDAEAQRWREAVSIRSGQSLPYLSNSNQLCVPRLPAIPFFDRSQFPFLERLEAKTEVIAAELEAALAADFDKFEPYIAYNPGDPVNQWRELNHSTRWSALHLWRSGKPVAENLDRFPETAAALESIELAGLDGLCPNAFFSALQPHTHIPPHYGESNARLICHLPLIVPGNCRFRVGFEVREWQVGKCLVFDDTIEHEAFNDSDKLRVVLIFDLWNPLLTEAERDMASRLAAATREFGSS
jgi:aspartyl/asparaginyl beta-hydroxylase (cupin superfamily)